jgi:hypothetical protein
MLSAEQIVAFETCPRKYQWLSRYATRISLMGALYRALAAGLKAEKNPEQAAANELLGIASNPGLDIYGGDIYAIATHYSWLAGILATALRQAFPDPWSDFPDSDIGNPTLGQHRWRSGLYDAGDGYPRRIVLVDKWSDDRKASEIRGWRTIGETVALRRPISLTAIEIGASRDKRRISPWTRCYHHPKNGPNGTFRFRRMNSDEDFSRAWKASWREDSGIPTAEWLARLQSDGCLDAVQTMTVPPPARPYDFLTRMCQIADNMKSWEERTGEHPPMRLAGCMDVVHGPCAFLNVCHGKSDPVPERYKFQPRIAPSERRSVPSGPPCERTALTPASAESDRETVPRSTAENR